MTVLWCAGRVSVCGLALLFSVIGIQLLVWPRPSVPHYHHPATQYASSVITYLSPSSHLYIQRRSFEVSSLHYIVALRHTHFELSNI